MSYIRSTSNPEGLYLWCDVRGRVHVWHRIEPGLASREQEFTVPRHALHHVGLAWDKGRHRITYRGLKVDEVALYDGGAPVKLTRKHPFGDGRPWRIVVRLTYRDHFLCMWPVTWEHIVRNIVAHAAPTARTKRAKRTKTKKRSAT